MIVGGGGDCGCGGRVVEGGGKEVRRGGDGMRVHLACYGSWKVGRCRCAKRRDAAKIYSIST